MTWPQIQDFLRLIGRFDWVEDRTLAIRPGREARARKAARSASRRVQRRSAGSLVTARIIMS